jgi:hypothetical protein
MIRFGRVGCFFLCPCGEVRKCRPVPNFFTSRQTLMPEFDQSFLYLDSPGRDRGPVSYETALGSASPSGILRMCAKIHTRRQGGDSRWVRSCALHLRGSNFLARSFSDRVIDAVCRSGALCDKAPGWSGIGIHQKSVVGLPRLRLTLLDDDHDRGENQDSQNSRCKTGRIAIESADGVPRHLTPFAPFVFSVLSNGF